VTGLERAESTRIAGPLRNISDGKGAEGLQLTLESMPKNGAHWSSRTMAVKACISNGHVSVIRRIFGLAPHRAETFQLSADPHFVERIRGVVVFCVSPPHLAQI
jgi:hypothetical protein